ncbi:MAG: DEAD/DEAH box helicase [Myxococcota bacterium]
MPTSPHIPALTPEGCLHLRPAADAPVLAQAVDSRIRDAFALSAARGLLHLGAAEVATALPQPWAWWRDLGVRYVTALRRAPEPTAGTLPEVPVPREDLPGLVLTAPPFPGGEYLDAVVLAAVWAELGVALADIADGNGLPGLHAWLSAQHPSWHAVGRVHLHLAEHKGDPELPFAFLATFTTRLSAAARPQHLPLGRAVREAAASGDPQGLLALLEPVQRAAAQSPWLAEKVAAGELYAPVRWSAAEALAFLREVPVLEQAGLLVRMPETWRGGRPGRAQVTATVGTVQSGGLGADALLDFRFGLTLEGQPLTPSEARHLLAGVDGLQLLRGQWIEVDRARLQAILQHYEAIQARAADGGLAFHEAMRLVAGADLNAKAGPDAESRAWGEVVCGAWLQDTLRELRDPAGHLAPVLAGDELRATLRPYQHHGVAWLHLLARLGLGACLADDMGLGKTVQVLALLLALKRQGRGGPSLVVMPASLLGNWQAEAARFAPSLRLRVAHGSATPGVALGECCDAALAGVDLVLTTYGTVLRDDGLRATQWRLCVLDEAQAIKNPGARQTRAVKTLQAQARIAMTGTPVENRLGDLWSLMDFLNPRLLGTAAEFSRYSKAVEATPDGYAPLRKLVQPYLLRRRKTDRTVIADLPDKTEVQAFCGLSRMQAALYQAAVEALRTQLAEAVGMARRGVVLAFLMRFKQICNHPSQWLGDGAWLPQDSGKFARLRELAEVVAERQEKLLVFTQFRETTAPLQAFLQGVFGQPGLVLHGGTPVRERSKLVARFQDDPTVPFFVLSLKAGGTGLNLTAASHVVHFDRWWNPAVEDQATDRAYRIGQKRNVLVHKLVCRGTIEERIDALVASKRDLADAVLTTGAEVSLTELSDRELLDMVRLDLAAAQAETA